MTDFEQQNDGHTSGDTLTENNKTPNKEDAGRRGFLKTAATIIGGMTVVASLTDEAAGQTQTTTANVYVSQIGPNGRPLAEIRVVSSVSPGSLASIVEQVVSNPAVQKAAGLAACAPCRSGLDINITDNFQEVLTVQG